MVLYQQGPSMTQYRSGASSDCPQSPTSPLSQHSYSPSQSPGLPNSTLGNSPFSDVYCMQQLYSQANVLQQQLEQFTMVSSVVITYSTVRTIHNGQFCCYSNS